MGDASGCDLCQAARRSATPGSWSTCADGHTIITPADYDPKRDASDRAMRAIGDLIVATTLGPEKGRFAQVGRLASIGQQLEAAVGSRVADFGHAAHAMGVGAVMPNPVGDDVQGNDVQGNVQEDHVGLVRQMLLYVGPYIQSMMEGQRARVRADEAEELAAISAAIMKGKVCVDADVEAGRTDTLAEWNRREYEALTIARQEIVEKMEARNKAAQKDGQTDDDEQLPMVPSDFSRGHLSQADGAQGDGGEGFRADAAGGGGDGGAQEKGSQARLAP